MKSLLLLLLIAPLGASAQILGLGKRLSEYKASNGVTYRVGDTVKIGRGSAPDGTFRYIQYGGWMAIMGEKGTDSHNLERNASGYGAVIKKIHRFSAHGIPKVVFAMGAGGLNNFDLWIEDAIATCEIADCKGGQAAVAPPPGDNLDRLKKLKALLDSGAITKAEYDEQKKRLLKE
jgi:hypothetical protein